MEETRAFMSRIATDVGGAFTTALAYLGHRLGLFRALTRPMTSDELAKATGLHERYVREWLKGLAAACYIETKDGLYWMTEAQSKVLADESSAVFCGGAFVTAMPTLLQAPRMLDAFRNGGGVCFADFGPELSEGIDLLHRPAFDHYLVQQWLPAIPQIRDGMSILDVGCGYGRSTIAIARAFPNSRVVGYDPDRESIRRAQATQLPNLEFVEAMPAGPFDVAMAFDCIHDVRDPVRVLRQIRERAKLFLWVEPTGSHDPIENRNPMGRMRATLSPLLCLTVSLAEGGAGLGTVIGEDGARKLADEAGWPQFEKLPIQNAMQQFFLLRP